MRTRQALLAIVAALAAACDAGTAAAPDAANDAAADAPAPFPTPPSLPVLTPCPPGWNEVTDGNPIVCEPWAAGDPLTCAFDEARFPGSAGCERIGTACPPDGWPADLPPDRPVVFVDDDAPSGGDGSSRLRALRSISAATFRAPPGAVIAIATGQYDEDVRVSTGQSLWGACVDGTRLTSSRPVVDEATIRVVGPGVEIRNLAIDAAERVGITVDAADADALIEDVVIAGGRDMGVAILRGPATLRRISIRGIRPVSDGSFGRGVHAQSPLVIERAEISGHADAALSATRPGTVVAARDLAIHDSTASAGRSAGGGVFVDQGARVVIERASLERTHRYALAVQHTDATVEAHDVIVRDPVAGSQSDACVYSIAGGRASLDRVLLHRCHEFAINTDAAVTARDLVVRDVLRGEPSGPTGGRGLEVDLGATIEFDRVVIERTAGAAMVAGGTGTRIDALDLSIRDTYEPPDGAARPDGEGVFIQEGAAVTLTRTHIERAWVVGVAAVNGGSATLVDVAVSGIRSSPCAATTCPEIQAGFGLTAHFGGALSATRFLIDDSALCGVVVGADGMTEGPSSLDLATGVIDHAPIGACVQVDGYDTERLHQDVEYRDVGVPLRATSYALPEGDPL